MNTTKRLLIFGIPFGIALLLAIQNMFFAQAQPVLRPNPSPTPEVLGNDWYRFTDPDAGYSIDYPSNAHLTVSNDLALDYKHIYITFLTSDTTSPQAMQIIVYSNNKGLSTEQIIERKIYQGKPPKKGRDIPFVAMKIRGLDATKMEMTPFFPAILISAKDKVYFLSLPMNMTQGNPPTPEAVDLFYQIINTFSLVPAVVPPS